MKWIVLLYVYKQYCDPCMLCSPAVKLTKKYKTHLTSFSQSQILLCKVEQCTDLKVFLSLCCVSVSTAVSMKMTALNSVQSNFAVNMLYHVFMFYHV